LPIAAHLIRDEVFHFAAAHVAVAVVRAVDGVRNFAGQQFRNR
jgi:hypothetical protein